MALGEKAQQLDLYGHSVRSGDHTLKPYEGLNKVATVPVKPLEHWLKNLSPETAVVMKLDVEGFELEVLKGMGEMPSRFRSFDIMVEDIIERPKIYSSLREKHAVPLAKFTPYNSWWRISNAP